MTRPTITVSALLAILLASPACEQGVTPTCAELGCPLEPSGTQDIWTPCEPDAEVCYCRDGEADVHGTACIVEE